MPIPEESKASSLAGLGDALGAALRPVELDAELSAATSAIRTVFDAAACSCALVRGDDELEFVAGTGAGAQAIVGVRLPVSRGVAGWVAMSGQAMVVGDVSREPRFARDVAESTDYVPTTILAAPLVDRSGEVLGVLEVLDPRSRGDHGGHDLAVLGGYGRLLGSVVRLSELYDSLGEGLLGGLCNESGQGFDAAWSGQGELTEVAVAFRGLAEQGPAEALLARQILTLVASHVSGRPSGRR